MSPSEVKTIFSFNAPPAPLANTLLKVVHSRRVNGALDLDPPPKLARKLKPYPNAWEDALRWLRQKHPIDEDAAILRRIEREDAGQGYEEYIIRAENLGLYKPQSGSYQAKLGEDGDIFGESELDKLRRANELNNQQEEKELDEYIEREQESRTKAKKKEKLGGLAAKREDAVEGMS